jgi:hypothetical protein
MSKKTEEFLKGVVAASVIAAGFCGAARASDVAQSNVVWDTPSKDASGVMPLGNGDIAAGVYAIENGDLYLLLAKNDAYTYQGDIFKSGRVRVSLSPNPFQAGQPFRQTLDLATGSIRIEAAGVTLRIWADANRPVYHVEIAGPEELTVTARPEFWKRFDHCSFNYSGYTSPDAVPAKEPTQDVKLERNGCILWYYAVGDRSIHADDLKAYNVESMGAKFADPFRFNTFGNLIESPMLALKEGVLTGKGKSIDIRIHALTMQAPETSKWIEAIEGLAAKPVDTKADWENHCRWWLAFWDRSWISVSDNTVAAELRGRLSGETVSGQREDEDEGALVAQSYNVFRFLMACQSRGRIQAKFNGGLFTQQLMLKEKRAFAADQPNGRSLTHEDDRLWGRRFTYQNQRLLYWPMLASGDFDLMMPFFDYYSSRLEMRRAITKAWFGHEGAYFRENIEPTGAERESCPAPQIILPLKTQVGEKYEGWYHDYYFTSGLETTAMMLDYVNFSGDTAFRDSVLVPFAREILLFFDKHYQRGADGKLRLDPAQVLETWWICVNPAPDIAGLRFCLDELLAMKAGSAEDQARWQNFRSEIPEVFLKTIDGKQAIMPAEKYEKRSNSENGELYPVFPFRCFGLALGSAGIVDWTMKHRTFKDSFGCACWSQDQIDWACSGNATEAARGLVRRARIATTICRFPLYGREGPDSCPDFDQFGSGAVALQRMLVQEGGGKIYLLPAWPVNWDVDFKLHLSGNAVVSGCVKDGKLQSWEIQPSARRGDVVVGVPQQVAVPTGPVVPANAHPLRAGSDNTGGNCFKGTIGRVTMFRGNLTAARVSELAAVDRSKGVSGANVVGSWLNPGAGDTLPTKAEDFDGAVSFEAWIQPGENEDGRIIDKLTAGTGDGFLLDAWPKLSLRLIVGDQQCSFSNVLQPGTWQHLAVVINHGKEVVYLDGKKQ